MLLLDECDVFLKVRSIHDLDRNKTVSIFLRTLEYYEGILFLTTNRVKHMDPASGSTIHISMEFPLLDVDARCKIWMKFLNGSVKCEITDEGVDRLAKMDLNGRQIKNTLKMNQLLARQKEELLKCSHLETVLSVGVWEANPSSARNPMPCWKLRVASGLFIDQTMGFGPGSRCLSPAE